MHDLVCQFCSTNFSVPTWRLKRARYCSLVCSQKAKAKISAKINGDLTRGSGEGKSYIKLNGRHMHRVVMEQKLGRPLQPGEVVHHKDENKRNNAPENLELLESQSVHASEHSRNGSFRRPAVVKLLKCTELGCDRNQSARGFCNIHYQRNYRRAAK